MSWSTYDVDPGREYKLELLSEQVHALGLPTLIGINEVEGVGLRFIFDEQKPPLDAINSINSVIVAHNAADVSLAEWKEQVKQESDVAIEEYAYVSADLRAAAEGAKDVTELQAVVVKLIDVTIALIDRLRG
jgi:hypothetical protein